MRRIPFAELANRITGISTPVFGVSWNPPALEREIARRLLTLLEDKRALYFPYDQEITMHVVESILEIRKHLTTELGLLDKSSPLAQSFAGMRAACRKFLSETQGIDARDVFSRHNPQWDGGGIIMTRNELRDRLKWDQNDIKFFSALGELRAIFGIYIAQISVKYGIDIDAELTAILPAESDEHP